MHFFLCLDSSEIDGGVKKTQNLAVECAVLKLPGALSLANPKMEIFSAACTRLNIFILGT